MNFFVQPTGTNASAARWFPTKCDGVIGNFQGDFDVASTKDAKDPMTREGVTRITSVESDPIAAELRKLYEDAAQEPLPDELTRLLDELDAAERRG